jgi:hypothetical protein
VYGANSINGNMYFQNVIRIMVIKLVWDPTSIYQEN